jgi:hypothetical protein
MDKVQEKKNVSIPSTVVCFMCYASLEYNVSQSLVHCIYKAKRFLSPSAGDMALWFLFDSTQMTLK